MDSLFKAKTQFSEISQFKSFNNFSVKAKSESKNAEIRIFGEIGEDEEYWGEGTNNTLSSLIGQIDALELDKDDEIDVLFTSQGGSMTVGNAIYAYIKGHPATFNGIVLAEASSSAFTMLMGCDSRKYYRSAFSLVHNPWTCGCGNHNKFTQLAEQLKIASNSTIEVYVDASNDTMDREAIVELMDNESLIDAEMALAMGFATEIIDTTTELDVSSVGDTRAFFAKQRACLTGDVKSKHEGKSMSGKETSPKETKNSGDEGLQAKNNILQDRLNTVEGDLKSSNEEIVALKASAVEVETAVSDREKELRKEVIEDMKQCAELTTKAEASGFKSEGDNSVEIMQSVLVSAGVPNATALTGDVLAEVFEFALAKNANKQVDETFNDNNVDNQDDDTDVFASTKNK